jgi:hypothetical protein
MDIKIFLSEIRLKFWSRLYLDKIMNAVVAHASVLKNQHHGEKNE